MFFTLSKLLGFATEPLALSVLLLALFALFKRRYPRTAITLFALGLAGLYACSTDPIADLLLWPLEGPYEKQAPPPKCDAIVVLTGVLDLKRPNTDQIELNSAGDRIVDAILLARAWPHCLLIPSGGTADLLDTSRNEAQLLATLAQRFGISPARIRVEGASRNTRESAVEMKKIFKRERILSFLLITSACHMRRSVGVYRKLHLSPIPYAVDFRNHLGKYGLFSFLPRIGNLESSTLALHETIGLVMYKLNGYL